MPSSAAGSCGRIAGTASAAAATSEKPRMVRVLAAGTGTRSISARSTVTSVLSLPTSALARWKPRSGNSESRLYPDTRRGMSG